MAAPKRYLAGGLQTPLEQRRWRTERERSMHVKLQRVTIKVALTGAGEASTLVSFPVTFVEEPVFYAGGAFQQSQGITDGSFPSFSAVVIGWDTSEKRPGLNVGDYYHGAGIAFVVGGVEEQTMFAHLSFEGKAFRNPDSSSDLGDLNTEI